MNPTYVEILSTVAIAFTFILALAVFVFLFNQRHQAFYNSEKSRAELEMLRSSIEHQIYRLTDRMVASEDRWRDANHLLVSKLEHQPAEASKDTTALASGFLKAYGVSEGNAAIDPLLVFALTPFNDDYLETYENIASACRELNLKCVRGDEQRVEGDLLPHIVQLMVKARLIIAVIDGRNPNVFYELGIAHALDKFVIMVARASKGVPIDLRSKKLVVYDGMADLRIKLQRELGRSLVELQSRELSNQTRTIGAGARLNQSGIP